MRKKNVSTFRVFVFISLLFKKIGNILIRITLDTDGFVRVIIIFGLLKLKLAFVRVLIIIP